MTLPAAGDLDLDLSFQSARADALKLAQLRQVSANLPRYLLITALSVIATAWLMQDWPFASNDAINRWATLFLVFLLCRGVGIWWLGRKLQYNLRLLRVVLPITALLTGLFWAYAIYSFNPRMFPGGETMVDTSNRQVLLAAILAAQGIAAIPAYVGYLRAYSYFSVAIFLPALVHLLLHPTTTTLTVASIGAIWWGFLVLTARYLSRTIQDSLVLRLDNEGLIRYLRDTQSQTLSANQQLAVEVKTRQLAEAALTALNDELESRVQRRTVALQESQTSLTMAIEAAGVALWDWRIQEGTLLHTNVQPLLGEEPDTDMDPLELARTRIHPDDLRTVRRNIVRHLRRRAPRYEARYRIKHHRGHWVWVEDRGRVVAWDSQGRPVRLLGVRRDISREYEAEETQRKLDYVTNHDRLTQLANRRLLRNRLHAAMTEARSEQTEVALLHLNLDRFRQVNESLGVEIGDGILRETGRRLMALGGSFDTLARLGGDEFALIHNRFKARHELDPRCEALIASLREPFRIGEHEILLGASIGISVFPDDGGEIPVLLNHASLAMQQAKRLGGNQWAFYSQDLRSVTIEQLNLENSLRKAVFRDEFVVFYQPKIDIASQRIVGMEALVRWQHPTLGLLAPSRFIALAEETGLISVITERVLQQAARQTRAWTDAGLGRLSIAVNIPPQQIHKGDFLAALEQTLAETGLAAEQLELELTETSLMADPEAAVRLLAVIRARGMRVALDDFGTGYSSLSHLRHFPLDVLKIDQTFVRELGESADDAAIVRAIITMAHELGIQVVAEGVEQAAQLMRLRELGCDLVQGYLFSRPVPAIDMEALLRRQSAGITG